MWQIIFAVVAGFLSWSVLWLGGNQLFGALAPKSLKPAEGQPQPPLGLVILLVLSLLCSLAAGAGADRLAPASQVAVWALGLLLAGILVQRK